MVGVKGVGGRGSGGPGAVRDPGGGWVGGGRGLGVVGSRDG